MASGNSNNGFQWAVQATGNFTPVGETTKTLPAGIYRAVVSNSGTPMMNPMVVRTDKLVEIRDAVGTEALAEIMEFFKSKKLYEDFGYLHKRGFLFEGDPGGGKTATMMLISNAAIKTVGAIVLIVDGAHSFGATQALLPIVRGLESERPIVVIIEDLDKLLGDIRAESLLSMLDGHDQVGGIVYLMTTNYLKKLDARFTQRPSRIDRIWSVSKPSESAREAYLAAFLEGKGINGDAIKSWAKVTEGLQIAHLKEFLIATCVLGHEPSAAVARLLGMSAPTVVPKQEPATIETEDVDAKIARLHEELDAAYDSKSESVV